jgi:hypothetical protein
MKKWVVYLIAALLTNSFSQTNVSPQFSELKGMEDQLGNTHLFYRIYTAGYGTMGYYYSNNIYRLNPVSGEDNFFLGEGGFADQFDQVNDYEFWKNDYNRYIYAGTHIYLEPSPEVYRYDQINPIFSPQMWGVSRNIELSRQDTNIVIFSVDNGFNYKSTDWGNNWDSISIGYEILSLSTFNHDIIFSSLGLNLLKSTNGGNTFFTVDTGKIYSPNFIYDSDGFHIHALNNRLGSHLVVSDNQGEAFSWQTKYSSDSKIIISNYASVSGTIYLADKKNILVSTDYGNNFSLYKTLERKIVGIYKKPNSNKLYAATKYKIYEITPDTIQVVKSLPIPEEVLNYYPLAIGNKWVYDEVTYVQDPYPNVYFRILVKEILGDTIAPNGKHYYKVNDETIWESSVLERVDSIEGKVYRYYEDSSLTENEYPAYDLLAELGDTISSYRMGFNTVMFTTMLAESSFNKWGMIKPKKVFQEYTLHPPIFSLTQDIGLDSIYFYFDFGNTWITLKGCIIDGVIYGDTTTVDVKDEENPIATTFKLEQNYPNPFNPSTKIKFTIPDSPLSFGEGQGVRLVVYDVLGNEIATLVNEELPAGEYEVEFNPASGIRNLASGIYFYQLSVGGPVRKDSFGETDSGQRFIQTKKMVYLK